MRLTTLLASLTLALPGLAQTEIGSPTINRPINDVSTGILMLYLGGTQPATVPGAIVRWSFFDNEPQTVGQRVTPFLCEQTGPSSWTVVAIGTSRASTGMGEQTHPFETLVGNPVMQPSKSYTAGVASAGFTWNGATLTQTSTSGGVIDFDGYGLQTDRWAYSTALLTLGLVLGTGGAPLDSLGSGGRIYSARFLVQSVVSYPGCQPVGDVLASRDSALLLGSPLTLEIRPQSSSNGAYLLWAGFPGVAQPSSCGLSLPGLGDFLLIPGSQITLATGAIDRRTVPIPLAVPNESGLIGAVLMFQALTADFQVPSIPVRLTNGLWAMIAR
ncbi:MAG: hypothetical protein JNM84_14625 [Planctomycetes bacterium]|nr:hypothetical protein [Planctomycetota bacterium]